MNGFKLIALAIYLTIFIGWILNIVSIFNANFNDISGMLVLRIIGVFIALLGGILGYF